MKRWLVPPLTVLCAFAVVISAHAAPLQPTADFQWTEGLGQKGIVIAPGTITGVTTNTIGLPPGVTGEWIAYDCSNYGLTNYVFPLNNNGCAHLYNVNLVTTTVTTGGTLFTYANPGITDDLSSRTVEIAFSYSGNGDTVVGTATNTVASMGYETTSGGCPTGNCMPYFDQNAPLAIHPIIATSSLAQYQSDGTTSITEGGVTSESTVVLKGVLLSSSTDPLVMEVEYRPITSTSPLTGVPNAFSSPVFSGSQTVITIAGLADTSYRWQARVHDTASGFYSPWQEFGTPGNTDFIVQTQPLPGDVIAEQLDGSLSVGTGCGGLCSGTVASQVFRAGRTANLASIEVFTSNFGTGSGNPDTNGCGLSLYNNDTNALIANADNGFSGYGCAGDLTFSFANTMPLLTGGTHYRWEYTLGGYYPGVTFAGAATNNVDGLFSPPGSAGVVNAEFIAHTLLAGPTALGQSDGTNAIAEGGTTNASSVVLSATLPSSSANPVQLQVELEPSYVAFTNQANLTSALLAPGSAASVSTSSLPAGGYHWQARAVDSQGNKSLLTTISNPPVDPDFATHDPASDIMLQDNVTTYSVGTGYYPCSGDGTIFSCALSPEFNNYSVGASFPVSKITFNWENVGSNNCDGAGNYGAILTSSNATSTILATSTNTIYMGCAGPPNLQTGEFDFSGQTIPKNFYLTFGAFDGVLQAGSGISVTNVEVHSVVYTPTLSHLQQFKSDSTTTIGDGSTTSENTVVLGGALQSSSTNPLRFQVEVQPYGTAFTNTATAVSSSTTSGQFATVTVSNLSDGSYHWQARAVDTVTGAVSPWQEFGIAGGISFKVRTVPLYTQVPSSFPDSISTGIWATQLYANGRGNIPPAACGLSIAQCGCAITSVVMIGRYYGINFGIDGRNLAPDNINAWLEATSTGNLMIGYDSHGNVKWSQAAAYAQDSSSGLGLHFDGLTQGQAVSTLNQYLAQLEPAILYERNVGHYIVADGQLATTYTIKDPDFYLARTLDDNVANTTSTHDYQNSWTNLRLFSSNLISSNIAQQGIYMNLGSPAELLVTDPNGNQLGVDPITSTTYNTISGGVYDSEGISDGSQANPSRPTESKYAWIPNPVNGTYSVQVIGTGSGGYTLQTLSYDASGTAHEAVGVGSTTPNQMDGYNLNFTPQEPQNITLTPQDATPPVISHSALAPQNFLDASSTQFTFSATDPDGPVASVTSTLDGTTITSPYTLTFGQDQIGNHTIIITASDPAGNTTSTSLSYNVGYHFGGFLPPIKTDGSGIYNLGRTLPIKFQLTDASGNFVSTAVAQLVVTQVQSGIVGTIPVTLATSTNDTGNLFRYDSSGNQYIYNFDTGQLTGGTWQIKVVLDDGNSYAVLISLR